MVLGRQVDIDVDQVVRKMLSEGVVRLLLVFGILGKGFEVLKVDMNTMEMWVRLKREQTLQGTLCSVKKSAVPEVA